MNWFYIALVAPILWSVSNYFDKFIIGKYFKAGGLGSIILLTCFFSSLILPFIYFFNHDVFSVLPFNALILAVFGAMGMVQLMIYFYALKEDSVTVVVPLFQIVPVISYILAYFILGEVLTTHQILASILILLGALILSIDITEGKPKIKKKVLGLMLFDCLLASIGSIVFKSIALNESFWSSIFWEYVGVGIFGLLIFIFVTSFRKQIISVVKSNSKTIFTVNFFNEVITLIASLTNSFALLLAPVALVQVVNGFQPFFVFIFGILLTLFVPKIGNESLAKKHLIQKIGAIGIIFIGTYFLNIF